MRDSHGKREDSSHIEKTWGRDADRCGPAGLNEGFDLGLDVSDLSRCFLRAENPIALLRGTRTLEEFGLRDGTVIHVI